jgi:methylthioribose-1-phosphate isomerase
MPIFQGSRLTAFELIHDKIPAILIADYAAAALIKQGRVQAVVAGADHIAANGMRPHSISNRRNIIFLWC